MKQNDIKNAFGPTPPEFRVEVNEMIDHLEDKPMKKRYKATTLLVAALVFILIGTAAVAGYQGAIANLFKDPEGKMNNEAVEPGIEALHASYEGNSVRCTMQEGLYDAEGGTYALTWELINLTGEDDLYVICDGASFDGEPGDWLCQSRATEFFLPEGTTVASMLGELPDNNANHCELTLSILRPIGPYTQDLAGYIDVDPQYFAGDDDITYSDALLAQGNFEIADRFTLDFYLDMTKLGSTARYLVGENDYKYDGYELNVTFGEITATHAHIIVEYISDEPIIDGGKGIGPNYDIDFIIPGGDIWWSGNSGGTLGDPEQLEDGRWMSVYDFEAVQLFTQRNELQLLFTTYPPAEDDGVDLNNPISHDEVNILLKFE